MAGGTDARRWRRFGLPVMQKCIEDRVVSIGSKTVGGGSDGRLSRCNRSASDIRTQRYVDCISSSSARDSVSDTSGKTLGDFTATCFFDNCTRKLTAEHTGNCCHRGSNWN